MTTKAIGKNRRRALLYLLLLAAAVALPLVFTRTFLRNMFILIGIWSIAGIGWNYIGGYAGQVSIGHAMFFAIGMYTPAALFDLYKITPLLAIPLGMLIAALVAVLVGIPLLRLHGPQFSIATMALTECTRYIFINWQALGGSSGISIFSKKVNKYLYLQLSANNDKVIYYYIVLAVVVGLIAFTLWLDKSRFGYALRTISGNENAAESVGIHTARTKAEAFALSAMVTSLAGSLYVQYIQYVDPYTSSTLSVSLMICLVTVMGGCGTVFGPVVGATVLTYISQNTRVWFGGTGTGIDLIIYGALVILVVLFLPKGVLSIPGILKKRFSKKEAPAT